MNIREWLGLASQPVQQQSKPKECIKIEDLTLQKAGDNTTWATWEALWGQMMLTVPENSKQCREYEYNRLVAKKYFSKYFDKPSDVPGYFNSCATQHLDREIVLWALRDDRNDVVEKCKSISYPVLDIVKSVLRSPEEWDVMYEFKEVLCSVFTYYTYKGDVVLGKQDIHDIAFTQLERELIEWCEGRINKIVTDRNMNNKREEFNNTWKELNE